MKFGCIVGGISIDTLNASHVSTLVFQICAQKMLTKFKLGDLVWFAKFNLSLNLSVD